MTVSSFYKFQPFVLAVTEKKHNLTSDQLMIALTNNAHPPVNTNGVLADLTEIAYTNLSSRVVTTTSNTQTGGVEKLILADLTLTASGAVAAFRYAVLYNNTATNKELIGYFDYGSDQTMSAGETFLIDFDATNGVLQLT
jgi:hypothetical protein